MPPAPTVEGKPLTPTKLPFCAMEALPFPSLRPQKEAKAGTNQAKPSLVFNHSSFPVLVLFFSNPCLAQTPKLPTGAWLQVKACGGISRQQYSPVATGAVTSPDGPVAKLALAFSLHAVPHITSYYPEGEFSRVRSTATPWDSSPASSRGRSGKLSPAAQAEDSADLYFPVSNSSCPAWTPPRCTARAKRARPTSSQRSVRSSTCTGGRVGCSSEASS